MGPDPWLRATLEQGFLTKITLICFLKNLLDLFLSLLGYSFPSAFFSPRLEQVHSGGRLRRKTSVMRRGVSGSYKPHSTESRKHKPLDNTVFQNPDNTPFINEQRVCAHICWQSGTPLQVNCIFFFLAILLAVVVIQVPVRYCNIWHYSNEKHYTKDPSILAGDTCLCS